MADPILGKYSYAYVGGSAVIHLRDWELTRNAPIIALDPDIGSTRIVNIPGFLSETGTMQFNLTNDDFSSFWDKVGAQTAVALYLYPHKTDTTNKWYLYGNAYLTDMVNTNPLLGTVNGRVSFANSDTTGFSRQNRA